MIRFRRLIQDERGYTLAFALGISLIMTVLGTGILDLTYNEIHMMTRYVDSTRAYYLAEAGVHHAMWKIDRGDDFDHIGTSESPMTLGDGSYWVTWDSGNGGILTSTGKLGDITRVITMRAAIVPSPASYDAAVYGGKYTEVPEEATVINGTTDTAKTVVVATDSASTFNIHGWIRNSGYGPYTTDGTGWAYAKSGSIQGDPEHARKATVDPEYQFPIVDTGTYDTKVNSADANGNSTADSNVTWSGLTVTLDATKNGSAYSGLSGTTPNGNMIDGNLSIVDSTITSNGSMEKPAELVVYGTVTLDGARVGLDGSDNWLRIMGGRTGDFTLRGANRNTRIRKEVRLYAYGKMNIYQFTKMNRGSIYVSGNGVSGSSPTLEMDAQNHSWGQQRSGGGDFNDIEVTTQSYGVTVGDGGRVFRTSNGGSTWTQVSDPDIGSQDLRGVSMPTSQRVYAVGGAGTLIYSGDYGASWEDQDPKHAASQLQGVYFIPGTTYGWIVGEGGKTSYTTTGVTWTASTSGTGGGYLNAVFFATASTGWAVGDGGTIYRSVNGGGGWTAQTSGVTKSLKGAYFADSNVGWVVGEDSYILVTNDAGANWKTQNSGSTSAPDLYDVKFLDLLEGYAAGASGEVLHTFNGGLSWKEPWKSGPTNVDFGGITVPDQLNIWAAGATGNIYYSSGPSIALEGIAVSKGTIKFKTSSGEIWTGGSLVAGYREPIPPYTAHDAKIDISTANGCLAGFNFYLGAMPSDTQSDISVADIQIDWRTWRER